MELVPEVKRLLGLGAAKANVFVPGDDTEETLPTLSASVSMTDEQFAKFLDDLASFDIRARAAGTSLLELMTHAAKHFLGVDLR